MNTNIHRKLSAVLSADVAGYSRLMSENESRTLEDLRRLRTDLFEPTVKRFEGDVIKRMGDGWLVDFKSALDAVQCAFAVQRELRDDPRIKLRIGIHVGDIVHEAEDIFGNGVNIASRLQEAVEPGGVAISGPTYNMVSTAVPEPFQDAGDQRLKNIPEPERVFVWNGRLLSHSNEKPDARSSRKSALIVLPFSTDEKAGEAPALAMGLWDTVITALSRFSWFLTIPRNISRIYEGEETTPETLRRDQDVSYAVEGKLRLAGGRVRVNVDLLDVNTSDSIWSGHFDGEAADPFEMEDRITRSILAEVLPRVLGAEARRVAIATDGSAWDLILKGRNLMWHVNEEDVASAQELFRQAIELHPESGIGHCDLSWSYTIQRIYGWGAALDETSLRAQETARAAVAADQGDAYALTAASFAQLLLSEADDAIFLAQRAIQLNPHLAVSHAAMALGYFQKGQYEDAHRFGEDSLQLSPQDPLRSMVRSARGMYFLMLDQTEELERNAREMIRDFPGMPTGYRQLAVAHVKSGQFAEAKRIVEEDILRLLPEHTASASGRQVPFGKNEEARKHWVNALVKAGLPL